MATTSASATAPDPPVYDNTKISAIDGIGVWRSWTRNFSTPLLAVLDLLDNCFDAADPVHGGIFVYADRDKDDSRNTRGMVIRNTCKLPIKPLSDILTAYKSSKGEAPDGDHIGENGVGIKQGCATLSDISFVLTRNGIDYEFGVIAKALQKPAGIYLPWFKFSCKLGETEEAKRATILRELSKICRENSDVLQVIEAYGGGDPGAGMCMVHGITCLAGHYMEMSKGAPYVFSLVVGTLKHGSSCTPETVETSANLQERRGLRTTRAHYLDTFLKKVGEELPRRYLHVAHSFRVVVSERPVSFSYWQRRLVELTHFHVVIDRERPLTLATMIADSRADEIEEEPKRYYLLDLYLGFDPIRCTGKDEKKEASLLWHSRRSGRLIKDVNDARGELKLTSGSSKFAQGLTIIVDDKKGALPLNPTKQDLAFGEDSRGETHYNNLISWIGSVTRGFYNHYLNICLGKQGDLTLLVSSTIDEAKKLVSVSLEEASRTKSINESTFTRFEGVQWQFRNLRPTMMKGKIFQVVHGKDSILRLPPPAAATAAVAVGTAAASAATAAITPLERKKTARKSTGGRSPAASAPKKHKGMLFGSVDSDDDSEPELPHLSSLRQQSVVDQLRLDVKKLQAELKDAEKQATSAEESLRQNRSQFKTSHSKIREDLEKERAENTRLRTQCKSNRSRTDREKAETERLRSIFRNKQSKTVKELEQQKAENARLHQRISDTRHRNGEGDPALAQSLQEKDQQLLTQGRMLKLFKRKTENLQQENRELLEMADGANDPCVKTENV